MASLADASKINLLQYPTPPQFRAFKLSTRNEVVAVSGCGQKAFKWIQEVEDKSVDISIGGCVPLFMETEFISGKIVSRYHGVNYESHFMCQSNRGELFGDKPP